MKTAYRSRIPMITRAKLLDEAATNDERSASEMAARLPTMRTSAKAARDRAERASGDTRIALVSQAEDLEADLALSEAETIAKRHAAADNRRAARDLRARAMKLLREPVDTSSPCDPPYRFTSDGRKIYRIECMK